MKECHTCLWWTPNQGPTEQAEYGLYECTNEALKKLKTLGTFGCNKHLGASATEVNVPQHTPKGTMEFKNATPMSGPVEILIVTYAKDFPWLEYALKCISKHATGFQGVTIAIPVHELSIFAHAMTQFALPMRENGRCFFLLHTYEEVAGKGFLQHEQKMAEAEKIVPHGTKFVMHMDADCMMKMSNEPRDYFLNDRPIYIWRTWDSLSSPDPHDPTKKVVSDCIMWREPTAKQVGFRSDAYTMCRHPTVFPIGFYQRYRAHVSDHHRMPFEEYMLSGDRNSHPQDRMDFTAMGQFAYEFMRNDFHWINCAKEEYPADRMKAYHSHSGFNPKVIGEIESFLT